MAPPLSSVLLGEASPGGSAHVGNGSCMRGGRQEEGAAGGAGQAIHSPITSHPCVYIILFSLLLMHILRRTSNTHPKTCLWKFFISKIFYFHGGSSDTEQPQRCGPTVLLPSLPVHLFLKNSASSPPTSPQQEPIIVTCGSSANLVLFLLTCLQAVIILQKIKYYLGLLKVSC